MGDKTPKCAAMNLIVPKLNPRQQRRKAQHELHAAKIVHTRLLGVDVSRLTAKTRANIHLLQVLINKESSWQRKT